MITCLTSSLPGVVRSTKTREFKVFFHVFEQHKYSMNASLSLKANTQIIFGGSAIFFLPLLFPFAVSCRCFSLLPLQYCRGFVFHTFISK